MPTQTGAKIVAEFLRKKNISHVFDVAGGMIAYIEDAVSRTSDIQCLPAHHEQCSGFAAEGYARAGRDFGVAAVTSGPGATNLITAIGSCYFDSVPTLFITGQVNQDDIKKNKKIRQNGFQETDIVSIIKTITKYSKLITDPKEVLFELEKAYFIMKDGRPGPVLLDIPINIQRTEVVGSELRRFFGSEEHKKLVRKNPKKNFKNEIKKLEKLLKDSRAPVVLAGGGVRISNTQKELRAFVKNNNIPVVSSLMGLDSFPGNDNNFVGFIGSYGNRDANIVFANADLIIALGSRLDVRQIGNAALFGKKAKIVHVDIDPNSINNIVKAHLSIKGNLVDFFESSKKLKTKKLNNWWRFIEQIKNNFSKEINRSNEVDPNLFISELSGSCDGNFTVVTDVGNHQMWLAQSWRTKADQRLLFSGGMGSMGFALPAAIGAYYANQKRNIVVVCGDGGFQMNLQELETVRHNKIPLKIFLLNNHSLGMVKDFQTTYLNKNFQSTIIGYSNPDYNKIAAAYGISYFKIDDGLKKINLKKILKLKKAMLVEVVIPTHKSLEPKVIFGNALDNQYPFLNDKKRKILESIKEDFKKSKKQKK